jgi:tetratricopeptide (TPR) repeat protein
MKTERNLHFFLWTAILFAALLALFPVAAHADGAVDLKDAQIALENGRLLNAIRFADQAIDSGDLTGVALGHAYVLRGIGLHRSGDPLRAIDSFFDSIQIYPRSVDAFSNLGLALDDVGRHEDALQALDRAVWLRPDLATTFYNRGNSYIRAGDPLKALEDYRRALDREPEMTKAMTNRASAYLQLGRNDDAIADYDRVIALTPEDAAAYFNRANAWINIGNFARAETDFGDAISRGQKTSAPYQRRGDTRFLLGKFVAAQEDYARALLAGADDGQLYLWHHLAAAHAGQANSGALAAALEAGKLGEWQAVAAALLLGFIDTDQAFAAAAPGRPDRDAVVRQARILFYVGEFQLLQGEIVQAVQSLRDSERLSAFRTREVMGATAELNRLGVRR